MRRLVEPTYHMTLEAAAENETNSSPFPQGNPIRTNLQEMLNLKNKTALITGGGTGIGQSIALHLAQEGCHVVLTGLGIDDLNKTKEMCEQYGVKAYATETQLDDYSSIDRLYDYVMEQGLSIDLFVLNAGISQREKALDTDISVDEKILKIDFLSGVYLVKKFKEMILAMEHVQFSVTTSLSGLFGFPLRSAYCAAKHALFGFYESLELEYDNINVTFLIPGRPSWRRHGPCQDGRGTGQRPQRGEMRSHRRARHQTAETPQAHRENRITNGTHSQMVFAFIL